MTNVHVSNHRPTNNYFKTCYSAALNGCPFSLYLLTDVLNVFSWKQITVYILSKGAEDNEIFNELRNYIYLHQSA